jgi:hypothetical protein
MRQELFDLGVRDLRTRKKSTPRLAHAARC